MLSSRHDGAAAHNDYLNKIKPAKLVWMEKGSKGFIPS